MPEKDKATLSPSDSANTVEGKMLTAERLADELDRIPSRIFDYGDWLADNKQAVADALRSLSALQSLVTRLEGERDEAKWEPREVIPPKDRLIWVTDGEAHIWLLKGTGEAFDALATACKWWCLARFPHLPDGRDPQTIENYDSKVLTQGPGK